jgi:hypothetical protein
MMWRGVRDCNALASNGDSACEPADCITRDIVEERWERWTKGHGLRGSTKGSRSNAAVRGSPTSLDLTRIDGKSRVFFFILLSSS